MTAFRKWLNTYDGEDVLDRAVWGNLPRYEIEELARDFGISYRDAVRAINAALGEE